MEIKNLFKIDPLKSFTELPAFRITIILSISLATIFTILIIFNSDIVWRFDYVGFNSFVEIFRVPLSILAIAVTVIAILATMHRSAQTKEQILSTNRQNIFSNYYKHIEEFEKYYKTITGNGPVYSYNLRLSYERLFPNASIGDYSINSKFILMVQNIYLDCIDLLNEFNKDNDYSLHKLIYQIRLKIDYVFSLLEMRIELGGKRLNVDGNIIVVPEKLKDYLADIRRVSVILSRLISFDNSASIPNSLIQLSNLNLSEVPECSILMNSNKVNKFNPFKIEE
jgi:hypothetical protein